MQACGTIPLVQSGLSRFLIRPSPLLPSPSLRPSILCSFGLACSSGLSLPPFAFGLHFPSSHVLLVCPCVFAIQLLPLRVGPRGLRPLLVGRIRISVLWHRPPTPPQDLLMPRPGHPAGFRRSRFLPSPLLAMFRPPTVSCCSRPFSPGCDRFGDRVRPVLYCRVAAMTTAPADQMPPAVSRPAPRLGLVPTSTRRQGIAPCCYQPPPITSTPPRSMRSPRDEQPATHPPRRDPGEMTAAAIWAIRLKRADRLQLQSPTTARL